MKNLLAKKEIKEKIKIALKEDFGRYGDITSKVLISKKTKLKASIVCLLYTSPSPRDKRQSRMPSSA